MIEILDPETHRLSETDRQWLQRKAASIFDASTCEPDDEASVLLVDDDAIREFNRDWRGLDEPTDVLSFALQESEDADLTPGMLGDIVISVEYAERTLAAGDHHRRVTGDLGRDPGAWGLREEVLFLLVHGFLHLLGHDHEDPDEEEEMKAEERRLFLAALEASTPARQP